MLYALCGFANFGSLGILLGGLNTLAPERRDEVLSIAPKSLISGRPVLLNITGQEGLVRFEATTNDSGGSFTVLRNNNGTLSRSNWINFSGTSDSLVVTGLPAEEVAPFRPANGDGPSPFPIFQEGEIATTQRLDVAHEPERACATDLLDE